MHLLLGSRPETHATMTRTHTADATICVDMGTTNTRLWIVNDGNIVERISEQVGLRDAARERNKSVVRDALRALIAAARAMATQRNLQAECVLAAGMLTSPLGLCEVPHIPAPVGEGELVQSLHKFTDIEVTDLPIYLVPGIRTGPPSPSLEDLDQTDLLRGEETVIVGLLQAQILPQSATLLNLGSHWKAIRIDEQFRIASSYTTLSGELIHALQAQTVLASALPQGRFDELDLQWLERGRRFQNSSGMGRSLFSVRLLEQIYHVGPIALSSFLLGAIVESDLRSMEKAKQLKDPIVITGAGAAARAWQSILQTTGRTSKLCDSEIVEQAFVQGLVRLLDLRRAQQF
jgi:2-dehydro-3-deoxygalactonokinase